MPMVEPPRAPYYYEDLAPGVDLPSVDVVVGAALIEGFGDLVGAHGLLERTGDVPGSLLAVLAIDGFLNSEVLTKSLVTVKDYAVAFARPAATGETLALSVGVTHRRLETDSSRGHVGFDLRVKASPRDVVLTGTATAIVLTNSPEAAREMERGRPSFGSSEWLDALATLVSENPDFADATAPFDGSIAVDFGVGAMGLRIYQGRIIDRGRAVANGATFTLLAPPVTWLRFASRPRNEFISFAMSDAFRVEGSTYEYLRMTRALVILTDVVRALFNGPDRR